LGFILEGRRRKEKEGQECSGLHTPLNVHNKRRRRQGAYPVLVAQAVENFTHVLGGNASWGGIHRSLERRQDDKVREFTLTLRSKGPRRTPRESTRADLGITCEMLTSSDSHRVWKTMSYRWKKKKKKKNKKNPERYPRLYASGERVKRRSRGVDPLAFPRTAHKVEQDREDPGTPG